MPVELIQSVAVVTPVARRIVPACARPAARLAVPPRQCSHWRSRSNRYSLPQTRLAQRSTSYPGWSMFRITLTKINERLPRYLIAQLRRSPVAARSAPESAEAWALRLRRMSDDSICYAWATSCDRLLSDPPAAERLAIAISRGLLLDELKRRDPFGFASWTASAASSSINPRRFIRSTIECPAARTRKHA